MIDLIAQQVPELARDMFTDAIDNARRELVARGELGPCAWLWQPGIGVMSERFRSRADIPTWASRHATPGAVLVAVVQAVSMPGALPIATFRVETADAEPIVFVARIAGRVLLEPELAPVWGPRWMQAPSQRGAAN